MFVSCSCREGVASASVRGKMDAASRLGSSSPGAKASLLQRATCKLRANRQRLRNGLPYLVLFFCACETRSSVGEEMRREADAMKGLYLFKKRRKP